MILAQRQRRPPTSARRTGPRAAALGAPISPRAARDNSIAPRWQAARFARADKAPTRGVRGRPAARPLIDSLLVGANLGAQGWAAPRRPAGPPVRRSAPIFGRAWPLGRGRAWHAGLAARRAQIGFIGQPQARRRRAPAANLHSAPAGAPRLARPPCLGAAGGGSSPGKRGRRPGGGPDAGRAAGPRLPALVPLELRRVQAPPSAPVEPWPRAAGAPLARALMKCSGAGATALGAPRAPDKLAPARAK